MFLWEHRRGFKCSSQREMLEALVQELLEETLFSILVVHLCLANDKNIINSERICARLPMSTSLTFFCWELVVDSRAVAK